MEAYNTNPEEFSKFHKLLTKGIPEFQPYYFPLNRNSKDPWERVSWKKNRKTFNEALFLMKRGYNIGIAATDTDPLVIIDVDDMSQVPEIKPTLQTTSRKRIGRHNYFIAENKEAKKNIAANSAGEIRSVWQYVVAPGSFVPCNEEAIKKMPEEERDNAGRYSLNNTLPVSKITFEDFPEVYKEAYKARTIVDTKATIRHLTRKPVNSYEGSKSALWDLTISDVAGICDTGGKRVPMPSEIHGSETGKNCSVSQGLLHCWRHEVTHNAFSYLAVLAGLYTCESAGMQHGGKYFGADSQDGETVFKVWQYAKNSRLLPENDPIPLKALIYYAIEKKICNKEKVSKECKLTSIEYRVTLAVAKTEGLNFGRK
ncbi:hypothetical protein EQO05_01010 [Methanosarcina sp. MSH10X1]|uniref:bifunctional DNA primase/polymerase n=1 Tax=Methanosarcina sp. MSH10X1 TaxID=2507075 RepID=UPI000FFBBA48|nr:bifunctional DNA primase/polymerase [Methanosarcina sp. MSH10X1]RXA21848.1 hypothetical protein EQO05_01010 [Methanosarcina sp. MSH10X1]